MAFDVKDRTGGVGCSSAAAFMGQHPWKTLVGVREDWLGLSSETRESWPMRVGHALEPMVRDWYRQEHLPVDRDLIWPEHGLEKDHRIMHADHDFIWFSPDGIVVNGEWQHPMDCKTGRSKSYGEPGTAEVPRYIYWQMQLGMEVLRSQGELRDDRADIPVYFKDRDEPALYRVPFNEDEARELVDRIQWFKDRYIDGGEIPEPQTESEVKAAYPEPRGGSALMATDRDIDLIQRVASLRDRKKQVEDDLRNAEVALKKIIRDAETVIYTGKPVATWKLQKGRKGFDKDALKVEMPEVYSKFEKEGEPYRVLRILKAAKEV